MRGRTSSRSASPAGARVSTSRASATSTPNRTLVDRPARAPVRSAPCKTRRHRLGGEAHAQTLRWRRGRTGRPPRAVPPGQPPPRGAAGARLAGAARTNSPLRPPGRAGHRRSLPASNTSATDPARRSTVGIRRASGRASAGSAPATPADGPGGRGRGSGTASPDVPGPPRAWGRTSDAPHRTDERPSHCQNGHGSRVILCIQTKATMFRTPPATRHTSPDRRAVEGGHRVAVDHRRQSQEAERQQVRSSVPTGGPAGPARRSRAGWPACRAAWPPHRRPPAPAGHRCWRRWRARRPPGSPPEGGQREHQRSSAAVSGLPDPHVDQHPPEIGAERAGCRQHLLQSGNRGDAGPQ